MPYVTDFDQQFPDPSTTPHDETLTAAIRAELSFLRIEDALDRDVWVDEDGRIFIDTLKPLSSDEREMVERAGYSVPLQPTVMGLRIQYRLAKR